MNKRSIAKVSRMLAFLGVVAGTSLVGSSCGGDAYTKGSFCSQIGVATCDRALTCTLITTSEKTACTSEFQAVCCGSDNSCGQTPTDAAMETTARQTATACSSALKTFSCTELDAGNVPTECSTLAASAMFSEP